MLNLDWSGGCFFFRSLILRFETGVVQKTWLLIIWAGLRDLLIPFLSGTSSLISIWCTYIHYILHLGLLTLWISLLHLLSHRMHLGIDKLKSDAKYYVWDDPYLWRFGSDQVIRRCVPDHEIQSILQFCHGTPTDSHFGPQWTARRILDGGFYWSTIFRDIHHFSTTCEQCQRA